MVYKITDNQAEKFADKKYWIVDVDGCQYPRDDKECGYFAALTKEIMKVFHDIIKNDEKGSEILNLTYSVLLEQGYKEDISKITGAYECFIPFVKAIKEIYPNDIIKYLDNIYGDYYHMIPEDNKIPEAFKLAREKGIEVYFYTSSPSGMRAGEVLHTQKIMQKNKFSAEDIEFFRPRTFDLLMALNSGYGKPSINSMKEFLEFFNVDPKKAIMFDDSLENLKTAKEFGIETVWTWTNDEEVSAPCNKLAEAISTVRVRNTGDTFFKLLEVA